MESTLISSQMNEFGIFKFGLQNQDCQNFKGYYKS